MFETIGSLFETIGTLITIAIWVLAIISFVGGIIMCIVNIKDGTGWEKFFAILALFLGIIAFGYVYSWCESIVWCMMASGFVFCIIGNAFSDEGGRNRKESPAPGGSRDDDDYLTEVLDDYYKQKMIEEAVENGIRNSKK